MMDNELYCPMKMTSNPLGRCVCEKEKCACVGYPYKWLWNEVAKHPYAYPVWKPIKEV